MKVLTIVKNDRITGVEYGMVEIGERIEKQHYANKYKSFQNQFKKTQRIVRTKQK